MHPHDARGRPPPGPSCPTPGQRSGTTGGPTPHQQHKWQPVPVPRQKGLPLDAAPLATTPTPGVSLSHAPASSSKLPHTPAHTLLPRGRPADPHGKSSPYSDHSVPAGEQCRVLKTPPRPILQLFPVWVSRGAARTAKLRHTHASQEPPAWYKFGETPSFYRFLNELF